MTIIIALVVGTLIAVTAPILRGSLLSGWTDAQTRQFFDTNGDGQMSAREMRKGLVTFVMRSAQHDSAFDANGDGVVNRDDVRSMVTVLRSTLTATCGDSRKEGLESCDDGPNNAASCTAEYGETCSFCSLSCAATVIQGPRCGDSIVSAQERCDDGNTVSGDGCSGHWCLSEQGAPLIECQSYKRVWEEVKYDPPADAWNVQSFLVPHSTTGERTVLAALFRSDGLFFFIRDGVIPAVMTVNTVTNQKRTVLFPRLAAGVASDNPQTWGTWNRRTLRFLAHDPMRKQIYIAGYSTFSPDIETGPDGSAIQPPHSWLMSVNAVTLQRSSLIRLPAELPSMFAEALQRVPAALDSERGLLFVAARMKANNEPALLLLDIAASPPVVLESYALPTGFFITDVAVDTSAERVYVALGSQGSSHSLVSASYVRRSLGAEVRRALDSAAFGRRILLHPDGSRLYLIGGLAPVFPVTQNGERVTEIATASLEVVRSAELAPPGDALTLNVFPDWQQNALSLHIHPTRFVNPFFLSTLKRVDLTTFVAIDLAQPFNNPLGNERILAGPFFPPRYGQGWVVPTSEHEIAQGGAIMTRSPLRLRSILFPAQCRL